MTIYQINKNQQCQIMTLLQNNIEKISNVAYNKSYDLGKFGDLTELNLGLGQD
jgi:hypothetical protein